MPVYHSGSGLVSTTGATQTRIVSLQGTMELQWTDYSSGSAGAVTTMKVNGDKLSGEPFVIPSANTGNILRFEGFRLLGTSKAIAFADTANPATLGAIVTDFYTTPSVGLFTILNGFGKVDVDNTSGENNIKNVSELAGLAVSNPNVLEVQQGAILFGRAIGPAHTIAEAGTSIGQTAVATTTLHGGSGKARLESLWNITVNDTAADAGENDIDFDDPAGIANDALIGSTFVNAGVVHTITDNTATNITFTPNLTADIDDNAVIEVSDPSFNLTTLRLDELTYPFTLNDEDGVQITPLGSGVIYYTTT